MTARGPVCGIFPALHRVGGVEASGRAACDVLRRMGTCEPLLFTYDAACPDSAAAKWSAVAEALRRRSKARMVVVWHLGLLKLVPFLVHGHAPLAVFLHGVEAWRRPDAVTRRLLRRVDLFLTNTAFTWERFCEHNPELAGAPHATVHLGLGEPADSSVTPHRMPAAVMLGRMSRAERYKGHAEVIAAWPSVVRQVPSAALWIAGPGDDREALESQARSLGVEASVRFFGAISEETKQDLLAMSRALLLPSRGEGFGLAYLEAMRAGRPCLASTLDAGREVVNPPECGLAADPSDLAALSGAITRLLGTGGEWNTWSRQSRARYEAHFTRACFERRLGAALEALA